MQYKLNEPVLIGDKKIENVEIKEKWNAGDFIDVQDAGEGKGQQGMRQVALAIDWPDPQVKMLRVDDYIEILRISTGFFVPNTKKAKGST